MFKNKNLPIPCPFCGGDNIKMHSFDISPECYIFCDECKAEISTEVPWRKYETVRMHDKRCWRKLILKWNRRTFKG